MELLRLRFQKNHWEELLVFLLNMTGREHPQAKKVIQFSSVQFLSRVWLFVTPWAAACQASLSFTISQSLLKLMSIDAIQSSHPLSSTSPPAFNLSQHQGLFQWVSSSHQVAKVLLWQYFGIVLQIHCSPNTNCIANTCIPNTHWKRPWY